MADSSWWRGAGATRGGPLASPQKGSARANPSTIDDQSSWRNHGTSNTTRRHPPPGLASNWRPKLQRLPLSPPAPRFAMPQHKRAYVQQSPRRFQPPRFAQRPGDGHTPALFLQSHKGDTTKTIFPSDPSVKLERPTVSHASIKVRPVATYTEAHRKGDRPTFEPWRPEEGRHPTPLAYNFTDSFPSAHGVRRTTLPDCSHFSYKHTMYDPSVSVVEEALRVPGVRDNLTKYPPDVLGDGVGLLAAILKRSFELPKVFPRQKRRSVVRMSSLSQDDRSGPSKDDESLASSKSCGSASGIVGKNANRGPLRLFCDNSIFYQDETFLGPRVEYICMQPDDEGDDELERRGLCVQPYGGFRLILEVTLAPEVEAGKDAPSPKLEPITVLMCTEVDASDMNDPNKWVELKTCSSKRNHTQFNRDSWCQAVLAGCQRAITLFHEGDKIVDIEAFDVSTSESTRYVENPKKHFAYVYNALKGMSELAEEPNRKYFVSERACPHGPGSWRKMSK